jgi:multidrug efflux pump subunit AcrA (membrane-fusion protein)
MGKASKKQQQAEHEQDDGSPRVDTGYTYDPSRRRTQAYSSTEIQRLSASHRARLERNRELAKASKERKKQHMQLLQQNTAELTAAVGALRAQLAAKQAALLQARAGTHMLLGACGCEACGRVQAKLQQMLGGGGQAPQQ